MNIRGKVIHLPPWTKYMKWPGLAAAALLLVAMIGYFIILFGGRFVVDEENLVLDEMTTVVTKDGTLIERIYSTNRHIVPISQIPEHVKNAFIAIEDQRFYEHGGVDFKAIVRALYRDLLAWEKVEGGSTITQQLAKNLFLSNDKTWMRKTKEAMAAIYLERNYTKDEILELYLNRIYFGEGAYGIQAAAEHYFNTDVSELSVAQGALLAALPKAPSYYSPEEHKKAAKQRRNLVLSNMEEMGVISIGLMKRMQGTTLALEMVEESKETWSNSYVDVVIDEAEKVYHIPREELKRGGYTLVVEMDPEIQRIASERMKNGAFIPGSNGPVEGAFTLMDTETGGLVAIIGGRDFVHGDLNLAQVKQSPASVIKPLAVYGPALMLEEYEPYTILSDERKTYDGGYSPENYDGRYEGKISLYESLVESKNAPAVSLLNEIGISYSKKYLEKLGLKTEDYGLHIALGGLSYGYTPIQLTEAYRSLAEGGKTIESYTISKIIDRNGNVIHKHKASERQVFTKQTAWYLTEMLQTAVEDGTGSAGEYPKALAGKTGTQQHNGAPGNKHVWFAGYTPEYAGVLWMGYENSGKSYSVEGGSSYPAALMKDILTRIDREKDLAEEFKKPEGVESLPEPIQLPVIDDLNGSIDLAGLATLSGTLTWTPSEDERVIYRIYREEEGKDVKVGEVTGQGEYSVSVFGIFEDRSYYVVPYNPLTRLEGKPSNVASLSWDF